jgi:RNA polymerase sigma factor (sigma-70 family)
MEQSTRDERDDERLARRISQGDASAVRLLFDEHAASIYRLLYRLLGDGDDAHDVLQESFLRAIREIDGYRGPSLGGWLRAVAYRLGLNRLRSDRRRRSRELKWMRDIRPDGRQPVDPDLLDAVEALPEDYRSVVLLFYFEDQPHGRIAEILDIPVGTSKTWLARARRQLRAQLGE